ncbi:MAG: VOC family protein [Pseudomonadota bacterium]
MLNVKKIDHVGIRVSEKDRSVAFYTDLGFELLSDAGFEEGHPIIMRNEAGIVLNLLGPSNEDQNVNILMDVDKKYAGYTHMALRVESIDDAKAHFAKKGFPLTGEMRFGDLQMVFIRDPDRNVIEFNEYPDSDPHTRS